MYSRSIISLRLSCYDVLYMSIWR